MIRKSWAALVVAALVLSFALPATALASKPALTCPSTASGFFVVDPDAWWARTVAGLETEGIPVYQADGVTFTETFDEFAAAVGFGSAAGLYDFVMNAQWQAMDKNGNGFVCMKDRPRTPGNPAYFFNGVDDQASTRQGEAG